jgi:hypothetical protein
MATSPNLPPCIALPTPNPDPKKSIIFIEDTSHSAGVVLPVVIDEDAAVVVVEVEPYAKFGMLPESNGGKGCILKLSGRFAGMSKGGLGFEFAAMGRLLRSGKSKDEKSKSIGRSERMLVEGSNEGRAFEPPKSIGEVGFNVFIQSSSQDWSVPRPRASPKPLAVDDDAAAEPCEGWPIFDIAKMEERRRSSESDC